MTTEDIIRPIIIKTYGNSGFIRDMATDVANKIDNFAPKPDDLEDENRERMIMMTCWNWMSGGSTAANVAKQIETALKDVA